MVEQESYLLITGMPLQILRLVILLSRPMPDRQGMATSVNTRSIRFCTSSRYCHACRPFSAEITTKERYAFCNQWTNITVTVSKKSNIDLAFTFEHKRKDIILIGNGMY